MEIIQTITLYKDQLSDDFLQQIIFMEKELLTQKVFEPFKTLDVNNLSYAHVPLREIFIRDMNLKPLIETELANNEKRIKRDVQRINKK